MLNSRILERIIQATVEEMRTANFTSNGKVFQIMVDIELFGNYFQTEIYNR